MPHAAVWAGGRMLLGMNPCTCVVPATCMQLVQHRRKQLKQQFAPPKHVSSATHPPPHSLAPTSATPPPCPPPTHAPSPDASPCHAQQALDAAAGPDADSQESVRLNNWQPVVAEHDQGTFITSSAVVSLLRTGLGLPADESGHLADLGGWPLEDSRHADGCLRVAFSMLHDGSMANEVELCHTLVQWPFLTDMSLVSAIISIFLPSWGQPMVSGGAADMATIVVVGVGGGGWAGACVGRGVPEEGGDVAHGAGCTCARHGMNTGACWEGAAACLRRCMGRFG